MQVIAEQEYQRLSQPGNLWYNQVAKERPTGETRKQRLLWLLDTARIEYQDRLGGDVFFDELMVKDQEYEWRAATAGLTLNRFQMEDLDGGGVDQASEWARMMGAQGAYFPQAQIASLIRNGGVAGNTAYDGLTFFNNAHLVNPLNSAAGTYANDLTGAASSTPATDPGDATYPGAVDISTAVTLDVALANLQKAIAYIRTIRMPNGSDPRMLRPKWLLGPPALTARLQQLTQAKFIAQASSSGGGSADIEAVVAAFGLGTPLIADELAAGFTNGSDTTWYIVTEQMATSTLGGILWFNREPFSIIYNGQMTSAELARANTLQWTTRGRNLAAYGHPYHIFRCRAA